MNKHNGNLVKHNLILTANRLRLITLLVIAVILIIAIIRDFQAPELFAFLSLLVTMLLGKQNNAGVPMDNPRAKSSLGAHPGGMPSDESGDQPQRIGVFQNMTIIVNSDPPSDNSKIVSTHHL
jgi:hypothetical protein